jgi:hypothetical protein
VLPRRINRVGPENNHRPPAVFKQQTRPALWVTNYEDYEWDVLDGSQLNILRVSPQGKVDIVITTEQMRGSTGSTTAPARPG